MAGFAHEVRTPLTGIMAIADLLNASALDERSARWVKTLKLSAEHLAALTTLVVDSARASRLGPRAAATLLRDETFDLGVLAQAAADSLAARAEAKGLVATHSIAKSASARFRGDPVRLRAALENLIDNAVKFTERGAVAMKVSARRGEGGRREIAFAITDEGVGLSAQGIRNLFRPFAQADSEVAQRFGGAGLGLYAVRSLARMMGGDVRVESAPAKGSTFTLTVALKPAGTRTTSSRQHKAAQRSLDLLCIEDNPYGRVVLNTILTELGHRATFAASGEAALKALARRRYDVILLDLVLPGISGIVTAKRIRAMAGAAGATPVVGLSGKDSDMRRALGAGMNAFLVKPASPRAIADALREVAGGGG